MLYLIPNPRIMSEKNFFDTNRLYEVKVFQIDKSFYELRKIKNNTEIVNYIVNQHRVNVGDPNLINTPIPNVQQDDVNYYSYVYNEEQKEAYWKKFLPSSITQHHNFEVQQLSFVLFAIVNNQVFAIIGGGGTRVIMRYINHRFGIEFFEHITIPEQDIINSITTRSISGRLVGRQGIYRNGQTLIDALSFTSIPTKINAYLRNDLKDTIFDFITFNNENVFIEIGSYFLLKHRVSFSELHELFKKIEEVLQNKDTYSLSSFNRVRDPDLVDNKYLSILLQRLMDDMVDRFYEFRSDRMIKFDIDFIHPSLMQLFYECDKYEIIAKNCQIPVVETTDRTELYTKGLNHLYNKFGPQCDKYEFGKYTLGLRVHGYRGNKLKTKAQFIQHLTCEIKHYNCPVFKIDRFWYKVKDNFIETINKQCITYMSNNRLPKGILDVFWNKKETEGSYNNKYKDKANYLVFDKVLGNNIEFCDIMYENNENIYLIHVKDGFDAKMRDLTNQIMISANRFKADIDLEKSKFIKELIEKYNDQNEIKLDLNSFINKFKSGKAIHYVMAYRSPYKKLSDINRILKSNSNIAKYSVINCFKEMASLYSLKVYDIANITFDNQTINIETILESLSSLKPVYSTN